MVNEFTVQVLYAPFDFAFVLRIGGMRKVRFEVIRKKHNIIRQTTMSRQTEKYNVRNLTLHVLCQWIRKCFLIFLVFGFLGCRWCSCQAIRCCWCSFCASLVRWSAMLALVMGTKEKFVFFSSFFLMWFSRDLQRAKCFCG